VIFSVHDGRELGVRLCRRRHCQNDRQRADEPRADEGAYCVRLNHIGAATIESVSRRTLLLRRMAQEFGGKYHGRETPVITG
jgi:hypothetical protein